MVHFVEGSEPVGFTFCNLNIFTDNISLSDQVTLDKTDVTCPACLVLLAETPDELDSELFNEGLCQLGQQNPLPEERAEKIFRLVGQKIGRSEKEITEGWKKTRDLRRLARRRYTGGLDS